MNWGRFVCAGILAGIIISIASYVVGAAIQVIAPYNVLALGGMRGIGDPIMLLFFAYPFVMGFAMAGLYCGFHKSFSGNERRREMRLGLAYWWAYTVPSVFVIITSMNYPLAFAANNLAGSLIGFLAAAYVIVRVMK